MPAVRSLLAAVLLVASSAALAQAYPRAEFTTFVKSEIAKWSKVARDSGAKAD
ncbi:MAG: hypothetical protein M3R58_09690 [Pseudomonadota bacterium]|nr:hypothetical protein [Pseudomonadota bacterium]